MCEWSDFYYTVLCECYFDQCASGLIFTTPECASTCLVNVRVARSLCASTVIGYVQVEMCEWSGHNVRVKMECVSASTVMCECLVMCEWPGHNVRVNMECASSSTVMCE